MRFTELCYINKVNVSNIHAIPIKLDIRKTNFLFIF